MLDSKYSSQWARTSSTASHSNLWKAIDWVQDQWASKLLVQDQPYGIDGHVMGNNNQSASPDIYNSQPHACSLHQQYNFNPKGHTPLVDWLTTFMQQVHSPSIPTQVSEFVCYTNRSYISLSQHTSSVQEPTITCRGGFLLYACWRSVNYGSENPLKHTWI